MLSAYFVAILWRPGVGAISSPLFDFGSTMRFEVLEFRPVAVDEFLAFWEQRYADAYPDRIEHLYADNIGKPLTEQRVLELFQWKNGGRLSARKQRSVVENYARGPREAPAAGEETAISRFLSQPGGAIWRIFWLHCLRPETFPIYDQHVHRAMARILDLPEPEIPVQDRQKIVAYVSQFLPFYRHFPLPPGRAVDKALFTFGQALKRHHP